MLVCSTTLVLEMPRLEFWLLAGLAIIIALSLFLVIDFLQKMIEKPSRDMPRLNTEPRITPEGPAMKALMSNLYGLWAL